MSKVSHSAVLVLADDDPIAREIVATLLTLDGHTVHTAADGAALLTVLSTLAAPPTLLLVDAQMPGLSGLELIARLRTATPARIALVSASDPGDALRTAVDYFLLKPFTPAQVTALLATPTALNDTDVRSLEGPVLDPVTLANLHRLMPAASVRQILSALVDDLQLRRQMLDEAIHRADAAAARRLGHQIKGAAAMIGATQLAMLGESIEQGALDGVCTGNHLVARPLICEDLLIAQHALAGMLIAEFPLLDTAAGA